MNLKEFVKTLKDNGYPVYLQTIPHKVDDDVVLSYQLISSTPDYTSLGVSKEELRVQLNIHAKTPEKIEQTYRDISNILFVKAAFVDSGRDDPVHQIKGIKKKYYRRIVDIKFWERVQ